jgi:drug/metabolite transporter (DMT)-like permease
MTDAASLRQGMLLSITAYALYAALDALTKLASAGGYPAWQLLFTITATAALTIVAIAFFTGGSRRLATKKLSFHIGRALFNVGSVFANIYALTRIPLPDFYSIVFLGPLMHITMGIFILNEKVHWQRWAAILCGFVGAVLMLPFAASEPLSGPALAYYVCLLQPVFTASGNLLVKKYGEGESNLSFPLYIALTITACSGVLLLAFGGIPFAVADLLKLIAAGVLSGLGTLCLMTALQRVPPAFVSPFQYSQMVWGVVFGFVLWKYVPNAQMLLGAAIVIVSGLFLFRHK